MFNTVNVRSVTFCPLDLSGVSWGLFPVLTEMTECAELTINDSFVTFCQIRRPGALLLNRFVLVARVVKSLKSVVSVRKCHSILRGLYVLKCLKPAPNRVRKWNILNILSVLHILTLSDILDDLGPDSWGVR